MSSSRPQASTSLTQNSTVPPVPEQLLERHARQARATGRRWHPNVSFQAEKQASRPIARFQAQSRPIQSTHQEKEDNHHGKS
ncbi:MAG: hypothetical protein LH479_11170 [Polaromonas sp.]|nr:hypothetical protein [Polaromonas sp.]